MFGTTHREVTHLISPELSTVVPGGWWLVLCPGRTEDGAVHRLAFCMHPAHRQMCIFLSPCSEDRKKAQRPPPCSLGWCHRLERNRDGGSPLKTVWSKELKAQTIIIAVTTMNPFTVDAGGPGQRTELWGVIS